MPAKCVQAGARTGGSCQQTKLAIKPVAEILLAKGLLLVVTCLTSHTLSDRLSSTLHLFARG